jgi:hypothetical protein
MLVIFIFSVVVQYNDPDPIAWMAIYGAAAVVCGLEIRRRSSWWAPAAILVIALVWGLGLAPHVIGVVPFTEMFSAFEMKDAGVEESREMYGLWIIAAWMAAVAVAAWRRRSASFQGAE